MAKTMTSFLVACLLASLLTTNIAATPPGDFYWVDETLHCNGSSAHQTALQSLFDQIESGGTLVFPPGITCLHQATLEIKLGANFVIEGNGATLELTGSTAEGGIDVDQSDNFEIRNLTLDGGWDTSTCLDPNPPDDPEGGQHQLRINRSSNGLVLNVRATGSVGDGFHVRSGGTMRVAEKIRFINVTGVDNYRHGLSVVEARDIEIVGGTFAGNCGARQDPDEPNSLLISSGIRIEPNRACEEVRNVLIRGVELRDNIGTGLQVAVQNCDDPCDCTDFELGSNISEIRLFDSVLRRNTRGAMRLSGGRALTLRGNLIEEHPDSVQGSTIRVSGNTGNVVFEGNRIVDVSTGFPAIDVEATLVNPGNGVQLTGNLFRDINLGELAGPAIRFAGDEGRIADNRFDQLGYEAIVASGPRPEIAGNRIRGGSRQVLAVDAEAATVIENLITVSTAGNNSATDAVVSISRDDNFVRGNTLVCADNNQRGLHFDTTAVLVTGNVVTGCDSSDWLALPVSPPALDNNVRTGGV